MHILSQTNDIRGYHGTIGTPTNMYDYRGEQLFVGDVVCLVTYGIDGKKCDDYGIEFVCEENTSIANWTGKNHQYVMGIASTYNNENFKVFDGVELNTEEWGEKFYTKVGFWKVRECPHIEVNIKCPHIITNSVTMSEVGRIDG